MPYKIVAANPQYEQRNGRRTKPKIAISTGAEPSGLELQVTSVAGFATMAPAFLKPMNAKNIPIPAVTANFKWLGIARTTACRAPMSERITNSAPEINTAPSAVCHGIFCPSTTV